MALRHVTLDDKYDLSQSRVFVTGFQALVRLCLMQQERDRRAGLRTAGFVTGYRGSPVGGLDQQFERAKKFLDVSHVKFQAGINEDLAATALWGTQQAELRGEGKYDGVFGMWYGKGPGVDRAGDVFRHANLAGTSKNGGVLAIAGDDHTASSSTTAHQSEFRFVDVLIPVLVPASLQEIVDYGLYGWAMSRFTGTWAALKVTQDTVEATGIIDGSIDRMQFSTPTDFAMPPGGLNIRLRDPVPVQEGRLYDFKRDAILAFLRANNLNRTVTSGGAAAKIGVVTLGKGYGDVRQALDDLGLDEVKCNAFGLRILKVGCAWPLNRADIVEFARGLELIIVVEEKESLVEAQIRELLYGTANQPAVIGKKDEQGKSLFPAKGALDVGAIAICIGERLLKVAPHAELAARVGDLKAMQRRLAEAENVGVRTAYFCSGCPHNTSTVVPEGMRAYAGIGCHYMAQSMDRSTLGFTQMGGEGANWMGEALFSERRHVFQNIGDGTYNHSGSLAIRAAVASGVNVTYKILYNDAVAMTGGQANDGALTVPMMARQVAGEGVARVVVVTDEPDKYSKSEAWPPGLTIHHRDELMQVQTGLAAIPGVTVLIYDQTCAAEKRRRRKRGLMDDPDKRVIINDLVCEGCGDCGVQSNCVSIQPLETEFGRKRRIDQSSCNKDFSCLKGFCPSFVTVEGGSLRRRETADVVADNLPPLPEPTLPDLAEPYGILVTGVGGTGVVTIGALLGMAAHLEGRGVTVLDQLGMAQKGGAVMSHVRIAQRPEAIHAVRIAAGAARLLLGCDLVVSGSAEALSRLRPGHSRAIVNSHETITGDFTRHPDLAFPGHDLRDSIAAAVGPGNAEFIEATRLATGLFGDSIATNLFMLGFAYQRSLVPVSAAAIERAIELNAVAVDANLGAFEWGRRAAVDPGSVEVRAVPKTARSDGHRLSETLDELIGRRVEFLEAYQNAAYARRYSERVRQVREAEAARIGGSTMLTDTVARALFKVMAYKDEYEVARLYSESDFLARVADQFEGPYELRFHLAPPLLAERDPATGHLQKRVYGPWMLTAFRLLARLRFLRGTKLDLFGRTAERQAERRLVAEYEAVLDDIMRALTPANHAIAVELAALPLEIRGFGHIKEKNLKRAKVTEADLLARLRSPPAPQVLAAE